MPIQPTKKRRSTAKKSSSSSRKTGSGRNKRKKPHRATKPRRWLGRLLALGFLCTLLLSIYILFLDYKVRVKFEGKRWAVPARVYGRPLELYVGAAITPEQLAAELAQLGYRKVKAPTQPGSWSRNAGHFRLLTRAFQFWDGTEPARTLDLRFKRQRLSRMQDQAVGELALMRLEAPEIGSIHPAHQEDRLLVQRSQLPDTFVQLLLAVEDRAFYSHHGVDPRGIFRAIWANIRARRLTQGGSTLTQQLIKNFYLTSARTIWRKLNEAVMALLLEAHYTKDEILEAYANEIFLGQDGSRAIHGFGLASRFYFNRPLAELDLSRQALLVALIRGPSYYNPRAHPERAKERRNLVLDILQGQGFVDTAAVAEAKRADLGLALRVSRSGGSYPAFMDFARRQLHRDYREEDLSSEGLRIFTTLDPWIQQQAEKALSGRLKTLEQQHRLAPGRLQGASVVVSRESGEVLAVVGGREAKYAGFNRALDAVRPIGSLVKPAIYLTALLQPQRYTLISRLDDSSISIQGPTGDVWSPDNYDHQEHGEVLLHQSLANSYNLATVRLGMELGLEEVVETLQKLGVNRPIQPVPAMLLGAVALSPMEVAQLYHTLGAGGFHSQIKGIREVQAADGEPLQRYPLRVSNAFTRAPVYLLNRILQEVVRSGTGKSLSRFLSPEMNIAGKTGTTGKLRDSWFAGFSGDMVAVVWTGRDDNTPAGLTGASGALQVWGDMMRKIDPAPLDLLQPDDVEKVWIAPESGLRADERCPEAQLYPFIDGSAPTIESGCVSGKIDGSIRGFMRRLFE